MVSKQQLCYLCLLSSSAEFICQFHVLASFCSPHRFLPLHLSLYGQAYSFVLHLLSLSTASSSIIAYSTFFVSTFFVSVRLLKHISLSLSRPTLVSQLNTKLMNCPFPFSPTRHLADSSSLSVKPLFPSSTSSLPPPLPSTQAIFLFFSWRTSNLDEDADDRMDAKLTWMRISDCVSEARRVPMGCRATTASVWAQNDTWRARLPPVYPPM